MARFTLETGSQMDNVLNELANATGSTKADVIRKAVATYAYLQHEAQGDQRISVTDQKTGRVIKDVILP